ncbi:ROK family protein [Caulobacter sp. S45]|uniref:ROK family protein n=1 Tax=Caulobacter sp. S45 TaxID=1641861 RepID=UPI0020C62E13|nr:ROK family protein [Caulobacter sp. S45]
MLTLEPIFAGVETGGTKILCKVVDRAGVTLAQARFATEGPLAAVEAIASCVASALTASRRLAGVGVASFGPIALDARAADYGRMLATPKPHWSGFDLHGALARRLDAPIVLDTDVNAAALAEQQMGAGRGFQTVAYVTIGTGIGAGLAIGGRTLRGAMHPEMGHVRLQRRDGDGLPSACPYHADCAEGLSAGPAIRRRLGEGVGLQARADVFALVSDYLAQLCETIVLAWSPQRLILGGGVMDTPGLRASVHEGLRRRIQVYGPQSAVAADGYLAAPQLEHAGLEGALWMARRLGADPPDGSGPAAHRP